MSEERPTLYLIAHRVRGEPAFDIATPLQIGDEEGWIIPTSGHRAHPYCCWLLNDLWLNGERDWDNLLSTIPPMPPNLPDHYSTSASPRTANPTAARDFLSSLGLLKPVESIKRRI